MKIIQNCEKFLEKEIGTISVSIYRDKKSGLSAFHIDTENDAVLPVSYVIEDTLKLY